jgi:ATPase family associated with various cellular activities (AAA)
LLYGPPGTGKTHTTRYLVGRMDGYTRLTLTGRALHAVGAIADLARELEPAMIVLEDVDLVAEHRTAGPGASPVLFDLLDAMDGAAPDADLLFVLTTNRADLLEPALAARPGRVEVAVEIPLPEAPARGQLLILYGRALPLRLTDAELEAVITRTEGVTASFLKELLRRAVLESLDDDPAMPSVEARHLNHALDDLLDGHQQLTRSLLGVGNDPDSLRQGAVLAGYPRTSPVAGDRGVSTAERQLSAGAADATGGAPHPCVCSLSARRSVRAAAPASRSAPLVWPKRSLVHPGVIALLAMTDTDERPFRIANRITERAAGRCSLAPRCARRHALLRVRRSLSSGS